MELRMMQYTVTASRTVMMLPALVAWMMTSATVMTITMTSVSPTIEEIHKLFGDDEADSDFDGFDEK